LSVKGKKKKKKKWLLFWDFMSAVVHLDYQFDWIKKHLED
jgi:hypothetical protein